MNYPVYPWGVIGRDRPDYAMMRHTYMRNRYRNEFGAGEQTIPAARLGLRDETYRQLYHLITSNQVMAQGLFMEHADAHHVYRGGRNHDDFMSYFNASGTFAQLVNEMFVQGHRGYIDAFAAFPVEWEGTFALLVEGGFFVCGETLRDAKVQYLTIESRLGGTCRLFNAWEQLPGENW